MNPFAMRLTESVGRIRLAYPPAYIWLIVGGAVPGLVFVWFFLGRDPESAPLFAILVPLWILVTAYNAIWLVWWCPIEFDRPQDRVRRGPRTIGRVSAIRAIAPNRNPRAALQLVFGDAAGRTHHWALQGVRTGDVATLGPQLATALGVPFEAGGQVETRR